MRWDEASATSTALTFCDMTIGAAAMSSPWPNVGGPGLPRSLRSGSWVGVDRHLDLVGDPDADPAGRRLATPGDGHMPGGGGQPGVQQGATHQAAGEADRELLTTRTMKVMIRLEY